MAIYNIKYIREKVSDDDAPSCRNSRDAALYCQKYLFPAEELWREKAYALFLDNNEKIAGHLLLGVGGYDNCCIDYKLVLKGVLDCHATGVILCHNHPSSNPRPSNSDIVETNRLSMTLKSIDIKLIDHIILGEKTFYSFNDEKVTTI